MSVFDFVFDDDEVGSPVGPEFVRVTSTPARPATSNCGIPRPFQRDGVSDILSACDVELVRANIIQILGTLALTEYALGEVPWRPEFGSLFSLLKHQNNDEVLQELGRVYVIDALAKWEPRVRVLEVDISRFTAHDQDDGLELHLRYDIIRPVNNSIVVRGQALDFTLGQ